MRLVAFTGKGGAGKTTIAAATALACAEGGRRTLLAGVDVTDAMTDVLGSAAEREPTPVGERLWAQRIDASHELQKRWPALVRWLAELASGRPEGPAVAGLAALPGISELIALIAVAEQARTGAYDAVVVDCPPAGTLTRLLAALDELPWWIQGLPRSDGAAARWLRPLLRRFADLPVPDEDASASVGELCDAADAAGRLLTDPSVTSFRLVCTPQRLSGLEAQRAYTTLALFDCPVDALIVNGGADLAGTVPPGSGDQSSLAGTIPASLRSLSILSIPRLDREPAGGAALADLGRRLYSGCDPMSVLAEVPRRALVTDQTGAWLCLPLPGVRAQDLSVMQSGSIITISTGSARRYIRVPGALLGMTCTDARYDGATLRLPFRRHTPVGAS